MTQKSELYSSENGCWNFWNVLLNQEMHKIGNWSEIRDPGWWMLSPGERNPDVPNWDEESIEHRIQIPV